MKKSVMQFCCKRQKRFFSNPQSGYLKEDGSDDEPTQIIEIVKDMSKVIKS